MKRFVIRTAMLALSGLVLQGKGYASPDPPLPWTSSTFTVHVDDRAITFKMDCPRGRLTRLSASSENRIAELPVEQLATLDLPDSCSGVKTRASREEEGSPDVVGVELEIELSREYIREELIVFFDLRGFKFTQARRLLTYAGESTQLTRVTF
jgi:hypothetical protein